MKHYNKIPRVFRAAATAATAVAVAAATLVGCTKVDDTLGQNLVPDNQELKAGFTVMGGVKDGKPNPKKYFETRLFQTDSILSSNISYGYFGMMQNDTIGLRTAGFLSQYVSYYTVKEGYFGYRPIFDSAQLMLSIKSYGGDTLEPQTFHVYEVIDNKYLTEKPIEPGASARDSNFFFTFDPQAAGIIADRPLFTFTFPDGKSTGPATTTITMIPTDEGRDFAMRLMLAKKGSKYENDYSIYSNDSIDYWVEEFKGLYIRPASNTVTKGGLYATALDASGFAIYGRNRVESDPTLIRDTLSMAYFFYDKYTKAGNVSVNSIKHDYSTATTTGDLRIDLENARESNESRTPTRYAVAEGMGGVVTELTFTEEFFDEMRSLYEGKTTESGTPFTSLGINQAKLMIYFPQSDYDWRQITQIDAMATQMDASLTRLGLYTDYKLLSGISDYYYIYEKQYSTELAYGGYINRSQGCYVMNITSYIQNLWNRYRKEADAARAEGRAVNLDKVEYRTVYLGPEAYSIFDPSFTVLQGMNDGENNAPIKLELTYTRVK